MFYKRRNSKLYSNPSLVILDSNTNYLSEIISNLVEGFNQEI